MRCDFCFRMPWAHAEFRGYSWSGLWPDLRLQSAHSAGCSYADRPSEFNLSWQVSPLLIYDLEHTCPELCLLISSQSKSHFSNLFPSSLYNTPRLPAPTLCRFYILLPYFPGSSHRYPGLLLFAGLLAPLSIVWPLPDWELQEIRSWPDGFSVISTNCLLWTCWHSVNIFKQMKVFT